MPRLVLRRVLKEPPPPPVVVIDSLTQLTDEPYEVMTDFGLLSIGDQFVMSSSGIPTTSVWTKTSKDSALCGGLPCHMRIRDEVFITLTTGKQPYLGGTYD